MSKFEDPINFDIKKKVGEIEIVYSALMEITQGGPEVGNISINGKLLEGRFGGPSIINERYFYAPIQINKIFGAGFRIAIINLENFEMKIIGKIIDLVFIDKVYQNRIYYFEDLNKSIEKYYDL